MDQKLDDSDTTKRDTIHKIGELDNNLSNEYGLSEANEAFIMADFQALQDATEKGKNATRQLECNLRLPFPLLRLADQQ